MREIRQSGSEGGEVQINEPSLPLSGDIPDAARDSRSRDSPEQRWQTSRRGNLDVVPAAGEQRALIGGLTSPSR